MSVSASFTEFLHDVFADFGPIQIRKMFGGAGIYKNGVMFGLIADDVLYFKVDETIVDRFRAQGTEQLVFTPANGKAIAMSYWQVPDHLFEDPEQLARWADRSHIVATATKKKRKKKPAP